MSLFKFRQDNDFTEFGADDIQLVKYKNVNVVNDYAWTVQPKSSRKDVPYLYMIERKVTNDVMVQQILYNLAAYKGLIETTADDFYKLLEKKIFEEKSAKTDDSGDDKPTEKNIELSEKEKSALKELFDSENPYAGLYSLKDTGWSYVLPYFTDTNHDISGNWGVAGEGGDIVDTLGASFSEGVGTIATSVNKITSAIGAISGVSDSVKPGTYIEKAKQYNFDAQGPSYSVKFDLYNTGKIQDVIDNWELCFALMYNLLPNRRNKTTFDPPPLYEIHIPGVRRSPASFISGMRVEFLGATRLMDLQVAGKQSLRTIVPDAYSITMTIEDVFPESKNFMQSMLSTDDKTRVRVTATTEDESVSREFEDTLKTDYNNITKITL